MNFSLTRFLGLAVLAAALTGCPPKKQIVKDDETPATDTQKTADEPSLRGKDYQEVSELKVIYFETDQATLKPEARTILQNNYQTLKNNPAWEILVEGHCDERGTTEYNLGLGQRRAASVRQYYISLGLSGSRVATLSYGKENPICTEATEGCWAQNRRGLTKARTVEKK